MGKKKKTKAQKQESGEKRAEKKRLRDIENLKKIREYKKKFGITGELDYPTTAKILNKNVGRKSGVILTRNGVINQKQFKKKKKTKKTKRKQRKNETFYESKEWRAIRWEVLVKYGFSCMACGRTKKEHDVILHVDHIKPRSKHPELELKFSNLQVLCQDCNLGKSNTDDTDLRPC